MAEAHSIDGTRILSPLPSCGLRGATQIMLFRALPFPKSDEKASPGETSLINGSQKCQ